MKGFPLGTESVLRLLYENGVATGWHFYIAVARLARWVGMSNHPVSIISHQLYEAGYIVRNVDDGSVSLSAKGKHFVEHTYPHLIKGVKNG